ncbi:hypothetical protein V6U90_00960 [Micromonospora sp. CPCC 206060]|uniref:imine reductase family protein n=1 Tax=Micromonospora sp. CPCC 206060 TaxID=3122406 RepID=UPI002FF3ACD0
MAPSHYLGPDPGLAGLWDLALLGSGSAALAGFLHGAALLDTAGVKPSEFLPPATWWLHGMTAFMAELGRDIEAGNYANGVSPVTLNQAAVDNLVRTSQLHGVDAEVHSPLRVLLDRRVADGHGTDSVASLFELIRRQQSPSPSSPSVFSALAPAGGPVAGSGGGRQ